MKQKYLMYDIPQQKIGTNALAVPVKGAVYTTACAHVRAKCIKEKEKRNERKLIKKKIIINRENMERIECTRALVYNRKMGKKNRVLQLINIVFLFFF